MQRPTVRVTRMRIKDLRPGDVVNKDPDVTRGWFAVTEVRKLHDGTLSVVGKVAQLTFSGYPDDVAGVQVLVGMDLPEAPQARSSHLIAPQVIAQPAAAAS